MNQILISIAEKIALSMYEGEACVLYTAKIDYVIDPNTQEKRLRTLGGCFFKLARKRMTKKERKEAK